MRDFVPGSEGVNAFHHLGNGSVKPKFLDVLPNFLDRSVHDLEEGGLPGIVAEFVPMGPLAFLSDDHGDSPDLGKEARDPLDALRIPRLYLLERAHEHLVEPECIRAILCYHVIRINDVAERLGHLAAIFSHDEALINEFLKWLGSIEMPKVIQDLMPETSVKQMQHGMLGTANVEVDSSCMARASKPVVSGLRRNKSLAICWVAVAQVIPA